MGSLLTCHSSFILHCFIVFELLSFHIECPDAKEKKQYSNDTGHHQASVLNVPIGLSYFN
jgi:hypothetical protein